ncbi:hypothetical protein LJC59_03915 [Desulfovibrio sp. OttesenSCG-928-A18]|nr:hypothetical protein [Desulfovibrio sp. OttesenSCG-928-A18]
MQSSTFPPSASPAQGGMAHDAQDEQHGEGGYGQAQKVSLSTSPRMRLFAIGVNLLVLVELFVAMFFASQNQATLTPVFFKIFFSLLVPTIIGAIVGRRLIARAER